MKLHPAHHAHHVHEAQGDLMAYASPNRRSGRGVDAKLGDLTLLG
jgi:hypothetical protein